MHERLISYLKDNRDQIIETWLLEAEITPIDISHTSSTTTCPAGLPVEFLTQSFDRTVQAIESGQVSEELPAGMHLDDILGVTSTCKQRTMGGRVCIELHDSGLGAFLSVFDAKWDTAHEFSELDHEQFSELINQALSGVFATEIKHCEYKNSRSDCPFAAGPLNSRATSE